MMFYVFFIILVPLISGETEVSIRKGIDITSSPSPHQDKIKVFSTYRDGLLTWGEEELVTDYMTLSEDPKGD